MHALLDASHTRMQKHPTQTQMQAGLLVVDSLAVFVLGSHGKYTLYLEPTHTHT